VRLDQFEPFAERLSKDFGVIAHNWRATATLRTIPRDPRNPSFMDGAGAIAAVADVASSLAAATPMERQVRTDASAVSVPSIDAGAVITHRVPLSLVFRDPLDPVRSHHTSTHVNALRSHGEETPRALRHSDRRDSS